MRNNNFGIVQIKNVQIKKWTVIPVAFLLVVSLVAGCASSSEKTVKSETTTSPTSQTTVVEKETIRTDRGHHGLLGGAFDVVGEILAFPFEVVADVFRFIF